MQGKHDDGEFWQKKIDKMSERCKKWSNRNLSFQGKVHILKSEVLSVIMYAIRLKVLPINYKDQIKKMIWNFIWNSKPERVKRNTCIRLKVDGGIGVPDIDKIIQAARLSMLAKILTGESERWKELPNKYLKILDEKYGIEFFSLKATCTKYEPLMSEIPTFYQEMIQSWQNLKTCECESEKHFNPYEQYLWCNHKIQLNNRPLTDSYWAKAGILKVRDILDKEGELKIDEIKNKVSNKAEVELKLIKIMKAIPADWKPLLRTNSYDETIDHDTIKLTIKINGKDRQLQKVTCKDIYRILLKYDYQKSRSEINIEEQWGEIDWYKIYREMCRKNPDIDRKKVDFNWKCLQNAVYTETKLHKIGLSNGMCQFCEIENEDTEHMLYLCETISGVWETVEAELKIKHNIDTNICYKDILLGRYDDSKNNAKERLLINQYISNTKWLLWTRRNELRYEQKWSDVTKIITNITK